MLIVNVIWQSFQKQKMVESPKIYLLLMRIFLLLLFNPQPVQPFGSKQEQRGSVKDGCKQMADVCSRGSPEPYTESGPINASWRRQRRTLPYNINTSSAVWLDEKRRAIVAFLNKDKDIWDSLLEKKVWANSPAPSYLCLTSHCQHYKCECLNRLVAESGAKLCLVKSQSNKTN